MRVESGELRVEQLAKLLKHAFALHYFKDKFHEAIAAELVANGVRLEEKQATSNASEQFASDNHVGGKWIPVTERLPEEHDSIFAKFYGTEKWVPGMFRTISDDVNACVEYEDGTSHVKTLHTLDGKWNLKGMGGKKVTHWMLLPEPPKGE